MSNGIKVGLLIVIAGVLGFVAWRQIQANDLDISSRPASGDVNSAISSSNASEGTVKVNKKQAAQEAAEGRTKTTWKFEKDLHNFGKLKQGESAEYSFKFTNTGKEPLVIENAQGSCGCTVPSYPKEPIAPGASGEIKVNFNSTGKSGAQQKTVTLTANTEPSISTILTIKADVEAPAAEASKK